jgi:hypothetical protein
VVAFSAGREDYLTLSETVRMLAEVDHD